MIYRLSLATTLLLATALSGCKKEKSEDPPPLPSATETATAPPPPPPATSTVNIVPTPPAPGQAPNTLAEAIMFSKPQMKDSTGTPDEGSATLQRYWAAKMYPWAQLEATSAVATAAFLANPDAGRGMRICEAGMIQALSTTAPTPPQHEGMMATKDGVVLSLGALGDITGMKASGPGKFCGIASGIQTIATPDGKQTRAIRLTGYFDTPANRGGGGGGSFAGLRACCAALQQNSASMPPPQNMYAAAAAQYCMATVASVSSPQQKDAMIAGIRGMLRGAPMPGGCR